MSKVDLALAGLGKKTDRQRRDEPAPRVRAEFPRSKDLEAAMEADAKAAFSMSAHASGVAAAHGYVDRAFGQQDTTSLALVLEANILRVHAGDMKEPEAMLMAQALALQSMFSLMARRAAANIGSGNDAMERYMRLAFKAQAQCRTTLETLGELKSPRAIAFVRQANIAQGPQQVNNCLPTLAHGKAAETAQNELLEDAHGNQVDTGTPSPAGRTHPQREAVGAVNRTAQRRR